MQQKGTLVIGGCGLHPGHMTLETQSAIEAADRVLVVAPNPLSIQHILQLNPKAENLGRFYREGVTRLETYHLMAEQMIDLVKQGFKVCTIFYGHPGIFVLSTHMAYEQLQKGGYQVTMMPGISADACLFADLNLDPATSGCQSFEATQFLLSERALDTSAALILWQIGLVGEHTLLKQAPGKQGLSAITRLLMQSYPAEHRVCLYQAPTLPGFKPSADWVRLQELASLQLTSTTTLFVPACTELKFAKKRLQWLGLTESDFSAWDEPVSDESV